MYIFEGLDVISMSSCLFRKPFITCEEMKEKDLQGASQFAYGKEIRRVLSLVMKLITSSSQYQSPPEIQRLITSHPKQPNSFP